MIKIIGQPTGPIQTVQSHGVEKVDAPRTGSLGGLEVRSGPASHAPARMEAFRDKVDAARAGFGDTIESLGHRLQFASADPSSGPRARGPSDEGA